MANYDFHDLLSYLDFEHLTQDLLEMELGLKFENFREGADQGIDLRYAPVRRPGRARAGVTGPTIVQCKRYKTFASLKAVLKNEERQKIEALAPARYILSTSLSLSPEQTDEIAAILSPYITTTGDIFSRERLNHLLGKHREVERRNVKLWATSAGVLDELLNASSHAVSRDEVNKTIAAARLYVKNDSFEEALGILHKQRVCIISGQPGIGKTTLARQLLLYFLNHNYEIVKIESDISEARDRSFHNKPRFYYYDDFLGQTGKADKLNKNEDQKLIDFMHSIRESRDSLFILTTREYILNQAQISYEKLDREKFDHRTCVIDLSKYSRLIRGQILYNHLHFSRTPEGHIRQLIDTGAYLQIIDHKGYNPRLVESLTAADWAANVAAADYPSLFLATLENPSEIWNHAFRHQLTHAARHLLLVLTTLRTDARLEDLRRAFDVFHEARCDRMRAVRTGQDLLFALKELDGTFIHNQDVGGETLVEFTNPSIRDFMQNVVCAGEWLDSLIDAFVFFEQAEWLDLLKNDESSKLPREELSRRAPQILAALQRTFFAGSCSFFVHGDSRRRHVYPVELNFANRLGTCINAREETSSLGEEAWFTEKLKWLTTQVREGKIEPIKFSSALDCFVGTGVFKTAAGRELAQTLKEVALDEPDSLNAFEALACLKEFLAELFSEADLKKVRYEYDAFAEAYACDHGIDGPDQIRAAAERVEDLGDAFGVDVYHHKETMRDEAREKEKEESRNTWEHADESRPGSASAQECSNHDLESMFRTLRG